MYLAWAIVACVPMEPSGQPFRAVTAESAPAGDAAPAVTSAKPTSPADDGFDFEAEAREAKQPIPPEATVPAATAGTLADVLPAARHPEAQSPPPAPAPVWDPSKPLADAAFGVRVVATLLDLQPPRAVLGLSNGREQVVRAGDLLEEQGLVVLAIGRDAVQIAKITPDGYQATVQTQTVQALYPGGRPATR